MPGPAASGWAPQRGLGWCLFQTEPLQAGAIKLLLGVDELTVASGSVSVSLKSTMYARSGSARSLVGVVEGRATILVWAAWWLLPTWFGGIPGNWGVEFGERGTSAGM